MLKKSKKCDVKVDSKKIDKSKKFVLWFDEIVLLTLLEVLALEESHSHRLTIISQKGITIILHQS